MQLTKAAAFVLYAPGVGEAFRAREPVRESSYFNPVFIAQPTPNRLHRVSADENLLALDVWTLGSSNSAKD